MVSKKKCTNLWTKKEKMILIMENKKINLSKGEVLVYDFGNVKVHDYNTCNALNDQVILLEKDKWGNFCFICFNW